MALLALTKNQIRKVKNFLLKIFCGLHGLILVPPFIAFVIAVQVPILFYRLILVKLIAPLFHPRVGKAVTVGGQFHAVEFLEDKIGKPAKYAIILNSVLSGSVSGEEMRQLLQERWIQSTKPDGTPKYPEFQQYLERWMGFMFWKQDNNFDVNNHVFAHELNNKWGADESEKFQCELVEEMLNKPYIAKRSPWEVHVVRNFKYGAPEGKDENINKEEEYTLVTIRFHHTLGDGFALTYAIVEGLFGDNLKLIHNQIPTEKMPILAKDVFGVDFVKLLTGPIQFLVDFGFVLSLLWRRQRPWRKEESKPDEESGENKSDAQIYARSQLISLPKLKFIKNTFGVSLSSLFQSCLGAALAKNFEAASPLIEKDELRLYMGLPVGGHKDKLRNNTLGAIFTIETASRLNPTERLLLTDQQFQQAKLSMVPRLLLFVTKILSASLAAPFASMIPSCRCISVGLANFPGPSTRFGLSEVNKVVSSDATCATYADLIFLIISYDGFIRISASAENKVLERSQLNDIIKDFSEEIETLHSLAMAKCRRQSLK